MFQENYMTTCLEAIPYNIFLSQVRLKRTPFTHLISLSVLSHRYLEISIFLANWKIVENRSFAAISNL